MKLQKSKKHSSVTNGNHSTAEIKQKQLDLKNGGAILKNKKTPIVTTVDKSKVEEISVKIMNTSIFQHFKELTSDDEQTRMAASLQLVQQLSKTKDIEKRQKELSYTLKRLVRGCGASTNISRAGFFTGLVVFLKTFAEEVTVVQVFDTLKKELHVGATIANKEDADAVVGKILTCGAFLHAGRVENITKQELEQLVNILLQASRHRKYHCSLSTSFLIELMEFLTPHQFESSVWPSLQKELIKPWPKQNLQTVHCLISVQKQFPHIITGKFLKTHFGGVELLNDESFQYVYKIFWEHGNTNILTHPSFELFGAHIARNAKLKEFWLNYVDPALETPTKLLEIETLKILTDILQNFKVEYTQPAELLSANFIHMFVEGLRNLKQKKDETIKAFYDELLEALIICCSKLSQDEQRVAVIKRLILPPGAFNIEKYTSTRIIHQLINQLGEEGVKEIYEVYKKIFLDIMPKNTENTSESWLNFERLNAGYMLQHLLAHKAVQSSTQWRTEQLQFFLTCGIFHVTDTMEICKKDDAGSFSKDFAEQCKNVFYTSLQSKLNDLQEEKNLLFNLVQFYNEHTISKHANKYFRVKHSDGTLQKSWQLMFEAVSNGTEESKSKNKKKTAQINSIHKSIGECDRNDKLELVFHILLLNMGLQLFREPEMAAPAIEDLLKCMQRTKEQRKNQLKIQVAMETNNATDPEPKWIEVVVDLFLHLLSQNASALRNIVNALFPHLCSNLNLSALHQILSMLDMKNGENPLSVKGESDDESDEDEEEEDNQVETTKSTKNGTLKSKDDGSVEKNSDSEDEEEENENDDEEDNKNDDEEEDEEDDDDDYDEDEEEVSATDRLRNAISQALIESGAAINGFESDMESVDLNDMTEEEGHKLDEALANAFKAMKKTTGISLSHSKKSKSYRVKVTTLMHFRIRVLDLIEIYLQQKPSLLCAIEIMLALFNMLEFCIGDELKPLQIKVEKVLNKLTTLKTCFCAAEELKGDNIVDFIRLIVEKKVPASAYDTTNRSRNKCIVFLICTALKVVVDTKTTKVLALLQEYIQEFINSRNPVINITLLSDILKLRWSGVWNLTEMLAEQGLNMQTRTFRRIQIYELLEVFYKNSELHKLDGKNIEKRLNLIENSVKEHIKHLAKADSDKQSAKEFQTLLELLLHIRKANARLCLQSVLNTPEIGVYIQKIRQHVRLESMHIYQRYCACSNLHVIRKNEIQLPVDLKPHDKTKEKTESDSDSATETNEKHTIGEQNNRHARKRSKQHSAKELQQLKKLKKQQRMEAASRGINGGFTFKQNSNSRFHQNTNEHEEDADEASEETLSDEA